MRLYTTHVGSFPVSFSQNNVRNVFKDLIKLGFNYPPVPQLRSFIDMFLDPLVELKILKKVGHYYIKEDFKEIPEDLDVYEITCINDFSKSISEPVLGIRSCITGPFTLASNILEKPDARILFGSVLRDKKVVLEVLTQYVSTLARKADSLGAKMIIVDEPILSVIVGRNEILFGYTKEELLLALDGIFERISSNFRGYHVCYRIPPLLKEILLELKNINILDHEHKDSPENLKLYSREELESSNKYLALGVVSSRKTEIESVEEIKSDIISAMEIFGEQLLFVKPDCGFYGYKGVFSDPEREYNLALKKLENIAEAIQAIYDERAYVQNFKKKE